MVKSTGSEKKKKVQVLESDCPGFPASSGLYNLGPWGNLAKPQFPHP